VLILLVTLVIVILEVMIVPKLHKQVGRLDQY
jgi:competence protein ComGC